MLYCVQSRESGAGGEVWVVELEKLGTDRERAWERASRGIEPVVGALAASHCLVGRDDEGRRMIFGETDARTRGGVLGAVGFTKHDDAIDDRALSL